MIDRDGSPGHRRTIAMWNPPIIDEALATRRSALGEAADLLAELVIEGARTIVFMKSRKAVELIARFASLALRGPRPTRAGGADRAVPRRLHGAAAARARAPAGGGRAARRRVDRRARAGDRHRLAGRGDLRDVPGHRRVAAPDVGPRGAARPWPGGVRRGRGRARPVLLPPPGRVPRPAGGGGDPRPRERADPRRAPAVRRARGAAGAARRRHARAALGATRRRRSRRPATCAGARDGSYVPRHPEEYPAARVALRSASRDAVAIVDVELRRAARQRRLRARVHHRPRGRRVPARRARRSRCARWTSRRAARSSSRSRATGTRSPSARPTPRSSG